MTSPDVISELAPTGVLRVALNHGNRVLAGRGSDGSPVGISVELARLLGAHLGLAVTFVEYERAVDVSSSATAGLWDVCFLAVDPDRARTIAFTDPYVAIEGCYLAGVHCDAGDADALIASEAAVGTVTGSAYTLTLQRKPGADRLVMYENIFAALAALDAQVVQAIAGIRQPMEHEAASRPGARVLLPPFMEIRQAMATPQGRPAASAALSAFLSDAVRHGTVGDILEAHGVSRSCAIMPGRPTPSM